MIIAIDGLTASGKGVLAHLLACHLGLPHMDTGKLYRALALAALHKDVALSNGPACARLAASLKPDSFDPKELRSDETGAAASQVSAHSAVRAALLKTQRDFACQPGGAVLDGRDIGTVICPEADVKFWVHAELACRAARRHAELAQAGDAPLLEDLQASLQARDLADAARAHAPMHKPANAIAIDTTRLDKRQMLDTALQAIEKQGLSDNAGGFVLDMSGEDWP